MTINFKRNAKRITLKGSTRAIINAYRYVLAENFAGNTQDTPNSNQQLLNKINWFANPELHKIDFIILPVLNENLEQPTLMILGCYRDSLYEWLNQIGKDSSVIDNDDIDSRYVLLSELLIRLAAISLSNNMDFIENKNVIVKIMDDFSEKITKDCLLDNQGIGGTLILRDVDRFNNRFAIYHKDKLIYISTIVSVIQLLMSKNDILTLITEYLKSSQRLIMRQTVARIDAQRFLSRINEYDFANNRIDETYHKHLADGEQIVDIDQAAKIRTLGNLHRITDWLYKYVSSYDLLKPTSKWVLIASGGLNLNEISNLIKTHSELMQQFLVMNINDPILRRHSQTLNKYNTPDNNLTDIIRLTLNTFNKLHSLTDEETQRRLIEHIPDMQESLRQIKYNAPPEFRPALLNNNNSFRLF